LALPNFRFWHFASVVGITQSGYSHHVGEMPLYKMGRKVGEIDGNDISKAHQTVFASENNDDVSPLFQFCIERVLLSLPGVEK